MGTKGRRKDERIENQINNFFTPLRYNVTINLRKRFIYELITNKAGRHVHQGLHYSMNCYGKFANG